MNGIIFGIILILCTGVAFFSGYMAGGKAAAEMIAQSIDKAFGLLDTSVEEQARFYEALTKTNSEELKK